MPIEFRCTQCNQLLRVPDDSAGKAARCPKCQALMTVPAAAGNLPFAEVAPGGGAAPPAKPPPDNPFGDATGRNPFGDVSGSPNLNPYASPGSALGVQSPFYVQPLPLQPVPVNPQRVGFETVFNLAWQVWQANLGVLVGVTLLVMVLPNVVNIPFGVARFILDQNGHTEVGFGVQMVGQILAGILQVFLSIGQSQILLKLIRRQPAAFAELFGGGSLFWPVLGASLLFGLMLFLSFLMLIVPCLFFFVIFWPFRLLIIDQKTGVIDSFSQAAAITRGNWGTTLLLMLVSVGLLFMGCVACYIGLLFAVPLISTLWVAAYLLMAGQISPYPTYAPPQKL